MSDMKEIDDRLQELGVERVRLTAITGTLAHHMHGRAVQWVAEHDENQKQQRLATEAEQREMTFKTLYWAKIATGAAIAATVIGLLAWLCPIK